MQHTGHAAYHLLMFAAERVVVAVWVAVAAPAAAAKAHALRALLVSAALQYKHAKTTCSRSRMFWT
jgi:hypothetical protein